MTGGLTLGKDDTEETGEYSLKRAPTQEVIGRVKVTMPKSDSKPNERTVDAIQGAITLVDEVLKARGELSPELRNRLSSWRAFALSVTKSS
jgi:hypothetical protein